MEAAEAESAVPDNDRMLVYVGEWTEEAETIEMSGMMTKSSGKTKVKGFDKRYFMLTRAALSYWKNEQAYIKAPSKKMKGRIELGSVCELKRRSAHPKLKKPLLALEPFELHTDAEADDVDAGGTDNNGGGSGSAVPGPARVYVLCGESAEDSARWFEAIRLAWLRHPKTMVRFSVIPPGLPPAKPQAPENKPNAFEARVTETEVVRQRVGAPGKLTVLTVSQAGQVFAGFDDDAGLFEWSPRKFAFEAVDGGSGRVTALAHGRADDSVLWASFGATSESSASVRRFSIPSCESGLAPFCDASVELGLPPGVTVEWLRFSEAESCVVAYGSDSSLTFVSSLTNSVAGRVTLEAPLAAAVLASEGSKLVGAYAGGVSRGALQVWRCAPEFGEHVAELSGAHAADASFAGQAALCAVGQGRVLSVGSDGVIALWNAAECVLEAKMMHPGHVPIGCAYSRAVGAVFSLARGVVAVWDAETLLARREIEVPVDVEHVTVLSDGGGVLVWGGDEVYAYDVASGAQLLKISPGLDVLAAPGDVGSSQAAAASESAMIVVASANSLLMRPRGARAVLELPYIEDRVESARRSMINLAEAQERWNAAVVAHQMEATTYDYCLAKHEELVQEFMVYLGTGA
ncbi:uncharacterized protein AMSG_09269 [Thecamonas trahens ATCC 50062]|uniref:PH domain-containing protein n=1 Tax=Thecamonas trahens ATCC 50062 TaxID=461836 RepID=A0A0L0DP40_THETB|nr:hypothetical protein AMSG_09269 [Thecamonas trahens ATCC 50062]KNC53188.1 hypothetical protein AMSG_09269 [Thecamonas trahens ATCC 50062]|eukprot:XP_013754660.1 hypothetical protein AMSG_09269 [Thecamonas trahens ATCC 50062]